MYEEIGEGAYGQVRVAKDKASGKTVAVKCVNIMKIC